jgi:hypothetical protein
MVVFYWRTLPSSSDVEKVKGFSKSRVHCKLGPFGDLFRRLWNFPYYAIPAWMRQQSSYFTILGLTNKLKVAHERNIYESVLFRITCLAGRQKILAGFAGLSAPQI